jgi:hypothetical protein
VKPARTHVRLLAVLKPDNPADLRGPEDLTDAAYDRLINAIEDAGFHVVDARTREAM